MTAVSRSGTYSGGFRQPVFDAQGVFRTVLDALARPGRVMALAPRTNPPKSLSPLLGDILCALADPETPVRLCTGLAKDPGIADWIRFQTGAAAVSSPQEAAFVVADDPHALPPLSRLAPGTSDYPDRSATVLVAVPALDGGEAVTLTGPGIKASATFAPRGVSRALWQQLVANHALYPRGIDTLFVSAGAIAGVPRSTAIEIGET